MLFLCIFPAVGLLILLVLAELVSGAIVFTAYHLFGKGEVIYASHPLFQSVAKPGILLRAGKQINVTKYDPWLGYRFMPEMTYELELKTDRRGFIVNASKDVIEIEKPTKTYRIFLLGGSTVAGWRATSSKTAIAAYLERFLNLPNYPIRNFQVINAGVVGYFSPKQLVRAQLELVHYRPDMIITLDGYNDFV